MFRETDQDNQHVTAYQRALRRAGIISGTALVGALAVGAVVGGTSVISAKAAHVDPQATQPPISVSVSPAEFTGAYTVTREFVGRIEPKRRVSLGFEEPGTIADVFVTEGALVRKGDVLAELDSRALRAERDRISAQRDSLDARIELAKLTYDRQRGLAVKSHSSQQRVDEARLGLAELRANRTAIDASLTAIDIRIEKHQIIAPFTGRVGDRYLDDGARTVPSAPVVDLIETGAPRVRVGLGAAMAARAEPGQVVTVLIGGNSVKLRLLSVRTDMETATRTQDALFEIVNARPEGYAFGDLVRIETQAQVPVRGAWIPMSSLIEGAHGLWSVYYLADASDDTIVLRENVEILHTESARAFVTSALPADAQIVMDGPHRLGAGQRVIAQEVR